MLFAEIFRYDLVERHGMILFEGLLALEERRTRECLVFLANYLLRLQHACLVAERMRLNFTGHELDTDVTGSGGQVRGD